MALLDLAAVTRTLVTLVDEAIKASPAAPASYLVTSLPPDRLTEDNQLGVYLYHLTEDPALKNHPWRGRPHSPSRYSPLALNLHFVVTAHSTAIDQHGPYREQLLMGLAVKALHDYPMLDDLTEIRGVRLLDPSLLGDENQLRLSLRHVPVGEAVSYWTAGSQPLRLSAYYEVSVILLEPEEPTAASGRVLAWGVETFLGGLPRLTGSRGVVRFTIPGEATPRAISVQPAQVAIGEELELVGSALGGGAIEVLVRGPGATTAQRVGPSWGASTAGDRVFLTVQERLDSAPALPGAYTACVQITRTTTRSDGTSAVTSVLSNETPFQIVPAVTAFGAPSPGGVFTLTGGLFADAAAPVTVRASISSLQLSLGVAGLLSPGEFAVVSATELQLRLPAGAVSGQVLPVRVIVNGSESAPRWVEVP